MFDFFDDFEGGFDDEFDDSMEDSADPDFDDDLNQEDDHSDGFDWDQVYWSGVGLGFAYEEGRLKRRKRKNPGSDDTSNID